MNAVHMSVQKQNRVAKKNKKYVQKRLKESWQWYLLILPAVIHLLIFSYGPMYGLQIAFKNYRPSKGIWGSDWVGLKYFLQFIEHPNFGVMIKNTLSITLYSLALFPLPILFALLLNEVKSLKFKKTVQMVTYMPHFLTEVVVCSIVILFLDRTGPINNLIVALGGESKNFMAMQEAFADIMVWSGMWQNLGWNAILYISALSSISIEQIEAARIDGANRFQVMRHINLPGIMPTILITLLLRMGGLLNVGHSKVLLLQNDLNLDSSRVLSTYVYEVGLTGGQYSYASAIGLFNTLLNVSILMFANIITKKLTDTGLF